VSLTAPTGAMIYARARARARAQARGRFSSMAAVIKSRRDSTGIEKNENSGESLNRAFDSRSLSAMNNNENAVREEGSRRSVTSINRAPPPSLPLPLSRRGRPRSKPVVVELKNSLPSLISFIARLVQFVNRISSARSREGSINFLR